MKEKLIELLCGVTCKGEEDFGNCPSRVGGRCYGIQSLHMCQLFAIVDHLLANGVVVPPAKAGQTVYFVLDDDALPEGWYMSDETVTEVCSRGFFVGAFDEVKNIVECVIPWSEIGKTVFLTKEEAEKAFAERIGEDSE